jgi:alpha-L-fucosidase
MKRFLLCLLLPASLFSSAQTKNIVAISPADSYNDIIKKAANIVPSNRQLKWQRLELTTFFHFGINTYTEREWGTGKESPSIFNPTQLDAEQWVKTAKDAGFKQVIITAKHHDGFCLWPTQTTLHSVKSSPWKSGKGDVVKEVAEACKKLNVGFGIYLSPWDMNTPVYGSEAYNDFFVKQLTELLTWYGKVDEVWFDGANGEGPNGKKQVYDFSRWYTLIRKLQPNAVIAVMGPDVRWVGTETGYGREQEWSVVPVNNLDQESITNNSQQKVAFKPAGDMRGSDLGSRDKILAVKGLAWYPAETDVSIRPGWFYHAKEDAKVKTPEKLLDIYFSSVGRNGVLLLNIPPDKRGLVHESDIAVLKEWKSRLDLIFSENLAKGSSVKINNKRNDKVLLDGNLETNLNLRAADTIVTIDFQLKKPSTFNVLRLQENIAKGQRIEKFQLEARVDGQWKLVTEGTTVGHKRLLQFEKVTASAVRLKILSSRLNPFLTELGLYYSDFTITGAQK